MHNTLIHNILTATDTHVMRRFSLLLWLMLTTAITLQAQVETTAPEEEFEGDVTMVQDRMPPMVSVGEVTLDGKEALFVHMHDIYVFPPRQFNTPKKRKQYNKLVNSVKKTLPIAKDANKILIETAEYLQTLPNKKARDQHMKKVEKEIFNTYKPKMKKLTFSQGKLLVKLIYRECNQSSYDVIRAFMGPIRAGFWQAFAWTFGASLRKKYDAEGDDKETERIVLLVEAGQL